jgi:hypothetical protein
VNSTQLQSASLTCVVGAEEAEMDSPGPQHLSAQPTGVPVGGESLWGPRTHRHPDSGVSVQDQLAPLLWVRQLSWRERVQSKALASSLGRKEGVEVGPIISFKDTC